MAEADKLLKEKLKRLDTVGDNFASASMQVQKTMLKNALGELEKLTRDASGKIIANTKNLNIVQSVISTIQSTLSQAEYQSLVSGLLSEMDKQAEINDKILEKQLGGVKNKSFADGMLDNIKKSTATNLTQVSTANISNGLAQFLNTAVSGGSTYKEVQAYVQDYLIGAEGKDGSLVRYTRQIANDSFAIADRSRIRIISESTGAEFYRYQGGEIDTTRCFCEERNGLIFHIEEIKAWGDGDITAGDMSSECGYPWQGMNTGTNSGNIVDLLGGYNCLHTLMPVSELDVPEEVLRRVMDAGYYTPSDEVKNLLNL